MRDRLGIVCCENISREVRKSIEDIGVEDIILSVYPPHGSIKDSHDGNELDAYHNISDQCDTILFIGCGCMNSLRMPEAQDGQTLQILGTGAAVLTSEGIHYQLMMKGYYVVLPGWLSGWRQHLESQGLDREAAKSLFGETVDCILLLDTGLYGDMNEELVSLAEYLELEHDQMLINTDVLTLKLTSIYYNWKCKKEQKELESEFDRSHKKLADYAMVFDLLSSLASLKDENDLIDTIIQTYELLFSPTRLRFIDVDEMDSLRICDCVGGEKAITDYLAGKTDQLLMKDDDGFYQRLSFQNNALGTMEVIQPSFPQYMSEYRSTSSFLGNIFGLALSNSRIYVQLKETINDLDNEVSERMKVEKALRQANRKLSLLSSITRHDINNYLAALMGYTEILSSKETDESHLRYLVKISDAADKISAMIRFTKEYEDVGVKTPEWQLVHDLVDTATYQSRHDDIEVINDVPKSIEVFSDPLLVKVFYNLIDNTSRHSETANRIRFYHEFTGESHNIVYEDDGVGIPEEEKDRIFERGVGKNTGMGMFLTREILSITDMKIMENGIPGKGVRFVISTPSENIRGCDD